MRISVGQKRLGVASTLIMLAITAVLIISGPAQAVSDTTPPAGVSNLGNISYAQNYINWMWIDPTDANFSYVIVYVDGSFRENVSKGVQFYNATGFAPESEHTIATRTADISGSVNQTWANHTARTASPIIVKIEISPKKINPKSKGVIKVTIYNNTPPGFDVASINISSVEFGPSKAKVFKSKTSADKKLILFIRTEETDIMCGDTQVNLTGKTYSGQDIFGNDIIETACPPPTDTIPPASVSNLRNISYAQTYINWTWIDPTDADLAGVLVWVDGSFEDIVSKDIHYYNATGFIPDSEHTIATRTFDASGNVNQTWVNHTARTAPFPDTIPPAGVSNLRNITYAQNYINWTWDDPIDADLDGVVIWVDGALITNVSKGVEFYNAPGFIPESEHTIATRTFDTSGNINQTWVNHTARTASPPIVVPDTIPPGSVSDLRNITYVETYINWIWIDPGDTDFSKVMIYLNDSFVTNVSKGVRFYNATGLTPDTSYNISTHTIDTSDNINQTWINHTARTAPSLLVEAPQAEAPSVSFGGAWAVTGECYENIAKSETKERDIVANKPVTYTFVSPEINIYQVVVTGRENEYSVSIKVELLKGPSCLVKAPAPGVIYTYLNVWSGSKRIEDVLIRFRVKNIWIENNNLARTDIRLLKWSKDEWKPWETRETGRDDIYTYFESQTKGLSMFAVAGLAAPTPTPEVAITPVAITPKPTPKAPENEIAAWIMALAAAASIMVITVAASIMVIAAIYLLRRWSQETIKRKGWV